MCIVTNCKLPDDGSNNGPKRLAENKWIVIMASGRLESGKRYQSN
jgi:hypothetical protein